MSPYVRAVVLGIFGGIVFIACDVAAVVCFHL